MNKMNVEEIKQKIMLHYPGGNMVKYDPNHRQKRLMKIFSEFDDNKKLFAPESAAQCFYEALNRQTGRTTETIIEALALMSEGVTVFISTGNNFRMQENIVNNLRRYSKQLGITMRYDKKDPDITLLDAIIDDMKFMEANRTDPAPSSASRQDSFELTFTRFEGAKSAEVQEHFVSQQAAEQAKAYIKASDDNTCDFNIRQSSIIPLTFDEWYKEIKNATKR